MRRVPRMARQDMFILSVAEVLSCQPVVFDVVGQLQLPHGDGPASCLHLMSMISMLDHDLAVVYMPLLPVPFVEMLNDRCVALVEVPEEEYPTMGPNVLALAPRRVLAIEGNPVTRRRMEAAGCEVVTYRGDELSLKAEGGATCLTRPVLRVR